MSLTLIIVLVTSLISWLALNNPVLRENLMFYPYRMWRSNEWHRLVSAGFIHADMMHWLFNMLALYSFGEFVEASFGNLFGVFGFTWYVLMYLGAIALADIANLFLRRDDGMYRSLGASGGVSAVVFSFILLNPYGKIYMFFIPVGIPAFIFGPLYLLYCVYMAKRGGDNIGHVAHFTGSLIGFVFPIVLEPRLITRFFNLIMNALNG